MTVSTFLTFMDRQKNVKQHKDLGEENQEVELHEKTAQKHSSFSKRCDATEFVEIKESQIKG